jgi:hypothetical protein
VCPIDSRMQHMPTDSSLAGCFVILALVASACTSSPARVSVSPAPSTESERARFQLFTTDPALYDTSLHALERMQTAIGEPGLALAAPDVARDCEPYRDGCGFELSFDDLVYCHGDPEPALACTSLAGGGKTLGIAMQAELRGDELENRLVHELFHVITLNRARHSADGLFMEYSVGNERISTGTLESVCSHFPCETFNAEE